MYGKSTIPILVYSLKMLTYSMNLNNIIIYIYNLALQYSFRF